MWKIAVLLGIGILYSCAGPDSRFERLSSTQTGVDFVNLIEETDSFNILNDEYMYNGGGVGVADFNQDGLQDLVFTGNKVSSRIYLNQGDFKFLDITEQFEGLTNDQWYSGIAIVDINEDGWLDLYLTSTSNPDPAKRKNRLWVHQGFDEAGLPSFREMAETYGIADSGYSVHASFFDYDLDGDLDLYVLNNIVNQFVPTNYRPKVTDGTAPNNDQLYQNQGNGQFRNVSQEAGIVYEGYGLGLAVGDVNKDGYPDLYVSNDYIANDLLYLNQRDGTFRNMADTLLSYTSKFSMGNDMSDVNNDGYPDVMTLDMLPEKYSRKKQTINGNSYFFYVNDERYGYQHQYVRNMLQLHNGFQEDEMLPFSEVGQMMGVYETEWSWSPLFADYDNDGDKDLLITNGFPKDLTDKDFTNYKAQMFGYLATEEQVLERIPSVKVPNYAYERVGEFQFENRTKDWGFDIPSFSNGAAFVDLDNDGDLDYVVNNIDEEAFLYQNRTQEDRNAPHYLRVQLQGPAANPLGIGAKVELWTPNGYQYYEQFLTRGYISSVEPIAHFGLGQEAQIDSVWVTWPGGKVSRIYNLSPDQTLEVSTEGAGSTPSRSRTYQPWFSLETGLIDYLHQQEDYIDFFQNQRIIQHKFSQIGPCLAKGDLNNDGLEDLVIGATNEVPTTVYLRNAKGFTRAQFPGLTDQKICTESDLILLDMDGDGDQDLVALAGGYVQPQEEAYQHYWYENLGDRFAQHALPIPAFPASVVRPFDFDQDGDSDFFVGARVKRGLFPYAGPSYLLLNEGGAFRPLNPDGYDLGMVTDAVWSDVDQDGFADLVITREWAAPIMLKNLQGQGLKPMVTPMLSQLSGFWSAVTAVDLDQDGDEDYLFGNLGTNHRFRVDMEHPMKLYAIDVDQNGAIDPITTAFWPNDEGVMEEYPVNYLDELVAQSPYFKKKFISYTAFSQSSIDGIIRVDSIPEDQTFTVNTTLSGILWNEEGGFRWSPFPAVLQMAPITEMLVRDFNRDGNPDVLIAGNDHRYDVSTGKFNANKGFLLVGKGSQDFQILTPAESGLLLDGQVESVEYFEGEPGYLVVGINREKMVVFRHQPPAK